MAIRKAKTAKKRVSRPPPPPPPRRAQQKPPPEPEHAPVQPEESPPQSRIVAGTVVMEGAGGIGEHALARTLRLEQAMHAAIMQAHDEGITDPDQIRARSLAAREQYLKDEAADAEARARQRETK